MWQQFAIPVTTVLCLFLVANGDIRVQRWGFVVGIIGQPIWIIRNFHNQEWGMLATSIVVTGLYLYGCRFFIKNHEKLEIAYLWKALRRKWPKLKEK